MLRTRYGQNTKNIDILRNMWYNWFNIEGVIPQIFCELMSTIGHTSSSGKVLMNETHMRAPVYEFFLKPKYQAMIRNLNRG